MMLKLNTFILKNRTQIRKEFKLSNSIDLNNCLDESDGRDTFALEFS